MYDMNNAFFKHEFACTFELIISTSPGSLTFRSLTFCKFCTL